MRSKRALRAFVLFLILAMVLSGSIGFATAAGEPTVLVPDPGPGDSAYYVVREVIDDPDVARGTVPYDWARLTWMDEETLPDESGKEQPFQPARFQLMFRQGTEYENLRDRTTHYDPATGVPAMDEHDYDSYYSGSQGLMGMGLGGYPGSDTEITIRLARGPAGLCGALTPLHSALEPPETMDVHGYCRDFTVMGDERTTPYRLVDRGVWQDRDTLVYEGPDGLRITYAEGVPFPVKAEVPLAEFIYEPYRFGRHFSLELRGFELGGSAYPDRPQRILDAPLPLVPRVPDIQIDETGLTGFTLANAYDAAMADPETPRLADFMQRPGAYIGAAWRNQLEDADGRVIHQWTLFATDGERNLGKIVQEDLSSYAMDLPADDLLPRQYTVQDPSYELADEFPPESRLPDRVPLVSAAMLRSQAYRGVDEANLWGFYTHCENAGCTDVTFAIRTGEEHLPSGTPAAGTEGNAPATQYTVFFAQDGMLSHTWAMEAEVGSEPLLPLASEPGQVPSSADGAQGSAVWLPPSGGAVASAGILAVLGAALYYFWPGLKVGALGLFSRIRDDQVLDHPRRRRIHEIIQAEPGIHFQELARRSETSRSALDHHLRKLVAARIVVRREGTGYACFFPRGAVDRRLMEVAPLLRADSTRAVLDAVAKAPGVTCADVAERVGLTSATVSYHLRKLRQAGLVSHGRALHVTADGEDALSTVAA